VRLLDTLGRRQPHDAAPVNAGWPSWLKYGGHEYPTGTLAGSDPNIADSSFESMIRKVHESNGPVSSAVTARMLLMSELDFAFQAPEPGSPYVRSSALDLLRFPANMTSSEFLKRLEQDASYAGNAYVARRAGSGEVFRLEPSRVIFKFGSNSEPTWNAAGDMLLPFDAKVIGLGYNQADGPGPLQARNVESFAVGEFAHWKPEPDPIHWWRGASWITSLLKDVVALDGQISDHQSKFFKNAATPNLVFMMDPRLDAEAVREYRDIIDGSHAGVRNHFRNMFLGGGTDVKVVGQDFDKLSLKDLQGGLETRISMRSRVPAVILGAREGLSGSSLNTGNYSAARRLFADGWFSPSVKSLCQSLESLVPPPAGMRLTHDPSAILFLQEDRKDEAEIDGAKVSAIRTLVDGGFDPASAVATIAPQWSDKLDHAGLLSVQLQEPGASASDSRAVMGRLGRVVDVASVDVDALVAGLDDDVAAAVVRAVADSDATDIADLRAEVRAVLTTGVTK